MMSVCRLILALATAILVGPFVADAARAQSPSLTEKLNAYVGCINRLSERSYESRTRYFSWVGKNGPTGKERIIYGTYTIYDTSDCKKNRREGQRARAARRRARSRSLGLCGGRGDARAAAQGGRRLLRAGELQGRQDGQGQGPASAPRRRMGCVRERRQDAARRHRSDQRQARAERLAEIEQHRRPQGALSCPGADDPRQARDARRKLPTSPTSPRSRRRSTTTKAIVKATEEFAAGNNGQQDRLDASSATPSRSSPRRSS